ncbi:hypothetical protein ABEX25_04205 [Paenibacillus thiaminolyticus]|uniref:hypothetical protein n=1 Tax=Paenibacillus thiaminolyticus TaxID=49283 RepID=UPI003D2D07CB
MKSVVRAFAVAMVAGGIFMGYYAGTEFVAVTGLVQWELAVAWWFIGFVGGALFFTLDIVLSHLQPAEHPNITKTERITENNKMTIIDRHNKATMEKKKLYPENFEAKTIGFTKREPPKSKTM